jgi:HAE1 family hydrophobic/amphiphilic exporter-1
MGGIVGQFFRQFGLVVAAATLFSLFISFTLTPMLSSRWLKSHEQEEADDARAAADPGPYKRFTNAWERQYSRLEGLYTQILTWSLHHHAAVICMGLMVLLASVGSAMKKPTLTNPKAGIALLLIIGVMGMIVLIGTALTAWARKRSPEVAPAGAPLGVTFLALALICLFVPTRFAFEFFPQSDRRQFSIKIEQAVGTPLDVTDVTASKIERDLRDGKTFPGVKTVSTLVGGTNGSRMGGGGGTEADTAQVDVELLDQPTGFAGLFAPSYPETTTFVKQANDMYGKEPGVKVTASMGGNSGPGGAPISIEVSGPDIKRTQEVANQIADIVRKTDGTFSTDLSWRSGRPELQAHIDRDRAAQYGLSVAQVASALRTSMEGDISSKYREGGKEYNIRVSLPEDERDIITQVPTMVVGTTSAGHPVYLYEVMRLEPAGGPTKIDRTNRQRSVTVSSQLYPTADLGSVKAILDPEIAKVDISGVTVNWAGQAQEMKESGASMGNALLLSVILVFILMAALFESLVAPFIIWLAVPQAMAGAIFALTITHSSLSIMSMIGIIMLVGLVTKNAILLVDYTNTLRHEHGLSVREALMRAGPTRLRPILMTTMAMIFGMLPTALAVSKGSEMRQPMATAVIGGLLLSMFLTLLMVPTFYEIIDHFADWFGRVKTKLLTRSGV